MFQSFLLAPPPCQGPEAARWDEKRHPRMSEGCFQAPWHTYPGSFYLSLSPAATFGKKEGSITLSLPLGSPISLTCVLLKISQIWGLITLVTGPSAVLVASGLGRDA